MNAVAAVAAAAAVVAVAAVAVPVQALMKQAREWQCQKKFWYSEIYHWLLAVTMLGLGGAVLNLEAAAAVATVKPTSSRQRCGVRCRG